MEKEKSVTLNENQLRQMAQQEENALMNLRANIEKVGALYGEAITARETLKEMQKSEGKAMVSIGATILVEAEIKNIKKCKRGFAENGYVEETTEETLKWLEKKEEVLKRQLEKLRQEYVTSERRLTEIIGILKQIEAEKKKVFEKSRQQPISISK